jgi:hypothetical protein
MRRRRASLVFVMPPRLIRLPLESSLGITPQYSLSEGNLYQIFHWRNEDLEVASVEK